MPLTQYTNWDHVPDHLRTKTRLGKDGLRPARGQKPVAVKIGRYGDYNLYDSNQAIRKKQLTEAQKEALAKGRAASEAKRTCQRCNYVEPLGRHYRNKRRIEGGVCSECSFFDWIDGQKQEATQWAQTILSLSSPVILDSETTGLGYRDEIIELAIIDLQGNTLFNCRFWPHCEVSPGAQHIHGISNADLIDCPRWYQYAPEVFKILHGRPVLIYNAEFDERLLRQTCHAHGFMPMPEIETDCVMLEYARYCGEWNYKYENFRWQKLTGGDHSALGDCLATLDTIKRMAQIEETTGEPDACL